MAQIAVLLPKPQSALRLTIARDSDLTPWTVETMKKIKIIVYMCKDFERYAFERESALATSAIHWTLVKEALNQETAKLAQGHDAACISTQDDGSEQALGWLCDAGIRFITLRSTGYDKIDFTALKKLGMRLSNVHYAPQSVAEMTLMLILMTQRHAKRIERQNERQQFSLSPLLARQLNDLSIGIIGAGHIGQSVIKLLKPFGCRLLVHSRALKNDTNVDYEITDFDNLIAQSDVISLHIPHTPENHHIIDAKVIENMKDKATLINTARGALIDTRAMIDALKRSKLAAVGLDVLEDEAESYLQKDGVPTRHWPYFEQLQTMDNAILTPHVGFYTQRAMQEIVDKVAQAAQDFVNGKKPTSEVIK